MTLQLDASRIWQWRSRDDEAESGKMLTTEPQGEVNVQLGGRSLGKPQFEKDLGIAVYSDISWTTQAQKRVEKAIKVFWSIKRNISKVSTWITRKKIYRSYVVPVISYGSSLWKACKADLERIEDVQKKAGFLDPADNATGTRRMPAKTPNSSTGDMS